MIALDAQRAYIAVTDPRWYANLLARPVLDEINFWRPTPNRSGATVGAIWFLKLKAPHNAIVGYGVVAHYSEMPLMLAWEAFGEKNGAPTFEEFVRLVRSNRRSEVRNKPDIGCAILTSPILLRRENWIAQPEDWAKQNVSGQFYDITHGEGARILREFQHLHVHSTNVPDLVATASPFGKPQLVRPRLGQGTFRMIVTDTYGRRCAVTGEKTLPALDAAHVKPFDIVQEHDVRNGILLRTDLHRLLDRGYVTITPDMKFHVSKAIRDEFENGREYYALEGKSVSIPSNAGYSLNHEYLDWHASERFKR